MAPIKEKHWRPIRYRPIRKVFELGMWMQSLVVAALICGHFRWKLLLDLYCVLLRFRSAERSADGMTSYVPMLLCFIPFTHISLHTLAGHGTRKHYSGNKAQTSPTSENGSKTELRWSWLQDFHKTWPQRRPFAIKQFVNVQKKVSWLRKEI